MGAIFKQVLYPVIVLEWLYLYFAPITEFNGGLLGYSWMLFTLAQVILCLKNNRIWLMVMWFFMLMYCFEPIRYFIDHEAVGYASQSRTPYTVYFVALYSYLFNIVLGYTTRVKEDLSFKKKPITLPAPSQLWLMCLLIGVALMIVSKSGDTILESGGYRRGNMSAGTGFGYAVIPLTIALLYANTKSRRKYTIFTCFCYVLKDLMYGGRVDSVILCILMFVVYFRYVLSKKQIIIILFIGIVFNQTFEVIRGSIYSKNLTDAIVSHVTEFSLSSGNTSEVYYASMRMLYMIKIGALNLHIRISSLVNFLLSVVVPYSKLPPEANLSLYKQSIFWSGGGGLMPIFIYVWSGIPGIILVAGIMGRILSLFIKEKLGKYMNFYVYFMIATIPRWYAYYPVQLIKLCVWGTILFMVTESIRLRHIDLPFGRRKHNTDLKA